MENQTIKQMDPNIELNEAKPPKTKKSKDYLIIAVLAMLLVACGSEPTPTVTTEKEEIIVEETTIEDTKPEDEEDVPEQVDEEVFEDTNTLETVSTDNLTIGSSIQYTVGKLTILDAGIVINDPNDFGTVLYMETELENTSDEAITLTNDDFVVYIDDYQVTLEIGYRDMNDYSTGTSYIEVNPGRKAKYVFRVSLPNEYFDAEKVEFGFPGTQQTLFIKENGSYIWEQSSQAEHDADGIIGEYTQVENPNITMEIYMDPAETCFILAVYFNDDRNSLVAFLDSGMLIDYFNEDLDGFYEYDESGFVLNSCIDSDADGHYQK